MFRVVARNSFICLLCCSLCLLGGCWSSVELSNRAFARLMLLDYSDEGVELTLGFPLTNRISSSKTGGTGGEASSETFTYVTKSGKNIAEAYRLIQADLSREVTFGQLRNVLLGRKFAEQGIKPLMDFIVRAHNVHINANLFVTEGNVLQFTKIPVTFEQFPTGILTNYAREHATIIITIKDVLVSTYAGGDMILPLLVFGKKGLTTKEKKAGENWVGTDGAAILKEGKMVGTLSTSEMRGSLWVIDQLRDAIISVESPADGKQIAFRIQQTKTKIKPRINGDEISFQIHSKANAGVLMTESDFNITDISHQKQLESQLESKVNERIEQAIARTIALRTDALHFGQYIRWRYPRKWKTLEPHWRATFANKVSIDIQTNITIKWLGVVRNPEWNRLLTVSEVDSK